MGPSASLILVTVFWGATFPLTRGSIQEIPTNFFLFMRFFMAALLFLPFVWKEIKWKALRAESSFFSLGVLMFFAFWLQTKGLETTTSGKAGFLTSVSVIFIPFLSRALLGTKIKLNGVLSALLALFGIFIMSNATFSQFSKGDLFVISSSFAYAFYVLWLERLTNGKVVNMKVASFMQVLSICVVSFLFSFYQINLNTISVLGESFVMGSLLFCAFFATVICFFLQTKCQAEVGANKATIIYTLEPMFAALFGYLLLAEPMKSYEIIGGGILIFSVLNSELQFLRWPLQRTSG